MGGTHSKFDFQNNITFRTSMYTRMKVIYLKIMFLSKLSVSIYLPDHFAPLPCCCLLLKNKDMQIQRPMIAQGLRVTTEFSVLSKSFVATLPSRLREEVTGRNSELKERQQGSKAMFS